MTIQPIAGSPQIRAMREAAIALSAKQLNPTLLNEEFLKFSGIVPNDWQLAKQPVLNPRLAQLSFKNGVSIMAQPRSVSFIESVGSKDLTDLAIGAIAAQFVQKLPHAEYQTFNLGSKILIPLPNGQDAARKFIAQIIAPGPWQEINGYPMEAGINLQYQLPQRQLMININEAKLRQPDQSIISAVLFSGSFNYSITNDEPERLKQLQERFAHWQHDWQTLQELIYQKFLSQTSEPTESVFPDRIL